MSIKSRQQQSFRQGFAYKAKLANLLEMPGREYAELISEIESNPLFIKLRYPKDGAAKAIRSKRLKQTGLSTRFFELNEEISAAPGSGGGDVEKLLLDKEKLVKKIKKIGEEYFKRYFIYSEEEMSIPDISERCGISSNETREILSLVNSVDLYSEFFVPSTALPENNLSYNKIAALKETASGYDILFYSAHWARGLYEIDHEKIEAMAKNGAFSKIEKENLNKLLQKMELANIKKSLMHTIISKLIEKQKQYLESEGNTELVPFMQVELAKEMNVHPSIISRSVYGRSIEMPWGVEKPLKDLFISAKLKQKQMILSRIKDIFDEEAIALENGSIKKPLSDENVSVLLRDRYSISISQRTVAKYRDELKLPGSFRRTKTS